MIVETNHIAGLLFIQPKVHADPRGAFYEGYSIDRYREAGITATFVQDNISYSQKNVLRGLHFQTKHAQGKLVSVIYGKVYDVIVDIRSDSPSFKQHTGLWLDDQLHQQVYIPPGCAHGFYVVSDMAILHYKCTDYYHPEEETGLIWNDSAFNISWPLIADEPILSAKDKLYQPFHPESC